MAASIHAIDRDPDRPTWGLTPKECRRFAVEGERLVGTIRAFTGMTGDQVSRFASVEDALRDLSTILESVIAARIGWKSGTFEDQIVKMVGQQAHETIMRRVELVILERALDIANGNIAMAARVLRMPRTTFIDRMTYVRGVTTNASTCARP